MPLVTSTADVACYQERLMASIFISYRRAEAADMAGRLYGQLLARFGRDAVSLDIDSIPSGADFRQFLVDYVRSADLVLVLIGPHWLGSTDAAGRRSID